MHVERTFSEQGGVVSREAKSLRKSILLARVRGAPHLPYDSPQENWGREPHVSASPACPCHERLVCMGRDESTQ